MKSPQTRRRHLIGNSGIIVFLYKSELCHLKTELQIRGGIEIFQRLFFLFLNKNLCCDPSVELSRRDGSNDGSQHTLWM